MLPIWVLALLLGTVVGKEVCFQKLGCFSDDAPWAGTLKRPLKVLPWSPKEVNTRFLLYSNENPNTCQELVADPSSINASNFKTDRKTRFIIHGFLDKGEGGWPADICKNMFQVESVNCICVDWNSGSHTTYTQATQNTRIVGAEVAYFVEVLQTALEYSPSSVHIIGHSLGAHAAGEAGRRTNGTVGRITGLDPAQPYFEGTPELVRLDASDAQFVDVIHTDTAPTVPNMGFGTSQISGHLDFFPNGGVHMPGCQRNVFSELVDIQGIWEGASNFIACNHLRSFQYYTDSILHPEGFAGFPCASYKTFTENKCFPCPSEGCPQMGHYADRFPGKTKEVGQTFYLNTGDAAGSFSRWRYKVTVTLSGEKARGHVLVSLFGNQGNSKQYEVFSGALQPASTHSSDIDSDVDVGDLQRVEFAWHKIINLTHPKVGASQITVERNDGKTYKFCSQSSVKEGVQLSLTPC